MIPVVWKSYHDSPARGYWDQELFEWLFTQRLPAGFTFQHHTEMPNVDGIVLVTPGHWLDATPVTEDLARYRWVLLIVVSDEEGTCPFWDVQHSNMIVWKYYARPSHSKQPDRYLPLAWPPGTLERNVEPPVKSVDWFFVGQVWHRRRREAVAAMKAQLKHIPGILFETPGFGQGWPHDTYIEELRKARIVLCPSGQNHPDTFRMGEALETGGVPIIDRRSPAGVVDPWGMTFHAPPPFPVMDDWPTIRRVVPDLLEAWPTIQHRSFAWWQQEKRAYIWQLHDDLVTLTGGEPPDLDATERITALVPTSPISRHPDMSIITQTLTSIRERLPAAEILVMVDGVRPEQEHYTERYNEYKTALLWMLNRMSGVWPVLFDEFQHQANMTRKTLELVRTPLILFVEHDTPLTGKIPFDKIGYQILSDRYNWVRFHWAADIHPEHRYLMEGDETVDGVRYMKTKQWSQRPHLARTSQYRRWIESIATTSRTMIEDAMYGLCVNSPWDEFRHVIYHPHGDMQRSLNLDGRNNDDPKYPMIYQ